jgi:HAD superfamily phosphoserine phosphatase-like hydrolase
LPLAIFDIDGTLVEGPSTEKRLFLALLRNGMLGPRQLGAFGAFAVRYWPLYRRHVFKKDKAYLSGIRAEDLDSFVVDWVAREAPRWWFGPCVQRLNQHQSSGDTVVLLSGTQDCVAREIGRVLGVEHTVGTRCSLDANVFVSRPPSVHPFADEKRRLAAEICGTYGVTPADVCAYGDSMHDVPILEFARHAVAVRPDRGLRREALERGWEILGERRATTDR